MMPHPVFAGAAGRSWPSGLTVRTESVRRLLLWLMGFAGAFVFIEPSPYEIVGLVSMLLIGVSGLSLRAALMPLALMLILLNIGYAIAVVQVAGESKAVTWVFVSGFLAVTAVFYAAVMGAHTQARLDCLLRGYLAAALIAALAGICSAACRIRSCSTAARAAPSTIPMCSAPSWCCRRCCCSSAC
jgi:hypothetical protein